MRADTCRTLGLSLALVCCAAASRWALQRALKREAAGAGEGVQADMIERCGAPPACSEPGSRRSPGAA